MCLFVLYILQYVCYVLDAGYMCNVPVYVYVLCDMTVRAKVCVLPCDRGVFGV
jgi:hypothetical protein